MYLIVCSNLTHQECNNVNSIIHTTNTPQNVVTFLLEAGGTSLVAYGERCVEEESDKRLVGPCCEL